MKFTISLVLMAVVSFTPTAIGSEQHNGQKGGFVSDARETETVEIQGHVVTPGTYTVDRPAMVWDIVRQAGGITEKGDRDAITVRRKIGGKTKTLSMKLYDIVVSGDQITVGNRSARTN